MFEWGWDRQKQDRTSKYVEYNATMDYKMIRWASSQCRQVPWARPSSPTSSCAPMRIAIARRHAPSGILRVRSPLEPGEGTLYKFDVELLGRARTYSITITRLTGKETDLRHLVVQGAGWRTKPFQICLIYVYIYKIYLIYIYVFLQSGLRRINAEEVSQCPCPGYFPNHRQWYLNLQPQGTNGDHHWWQPARIPNLPWVSIRSHGLKTTRDDLQNAPPFCWLCLLAFLAYLTSRCFGWLYFSLP